MSIVAIWASNFVSIFYPTKCSFFEYNARIPRALYSKILCTLCRLRRLVALFVDSWSRRWNHLSVGFMLFGSKCQGFLKWVSIKMLMQECGENCHWRHSNGHTYRLNLNIQNKFFKFIIFIKKQLFINQTEDAIINKSDFLNLIKV